MNIQPLRRWCIVLAGFAPEPLFGDIGLTTTTSLSNFGGAMVLADALGGLEVDLELRIAPESDDTNIAREVLLC